MRWRESTKRAQKAYRAKGKQVHFFLNEHDKDIMDWLERQASVTAKIKELIRADIEK